MAILDNFTVIAENTASTGNTGTTAAVGTAIPLGTPRDIGNGQPIYLVLQVSTTFVGAGASVNFQVVSDATSTLAVDGSATVHLQTGAIPVTALVRGWRRVFELPLGNYENFLGILSAKTGANVTAGSIDVYLSPDKTQWKAYREGVF